MSWRWIGVVALVACGRTGPELGSEERTPKEPPPVDVDSGLTGCTAPVETCGELPFELPKAYRCDLSATELRGVGVFAVATPSGLYLIRGGESDPVLLRRFSLVAEEGVSLGTPRLLTRGNWMAATVTRRPFAGGDFLVEIVVADGSGTVVYNEVYPSDNSGLQYELFGNDRGLFVLSLEMRGERVHHVVFPEGKLTVGGDFTVLADPGPDGWVLVRNATDPSRPGYDWFDLLGSQQRRSCHRERPTYAPVQVLSPGIAYVVNESSELIYERAFERCRLELPVLAQGGYDVLDTNRQGWVELGWYDAGLNILTANVATGSQLPGYALEPPPDRSLPNEDAWAISTRKGLVDYAGATVTSTERTDEEGTTYYQLHRTFDGARWEALGNELLLYPGMATTRAIDEANGTYLLGAYWLTETGGGHYVTHAVRRLSGVVRDVHALFGTTVVSDDGRCIGWIGDEGRVLMVDMWPGETYEGPSVDVDDPRLAAYGFVY